jgi:hypothetical protein
MRSGVAVTSVAALCMSMLFASSAAHEHASVVRAEARSPGASVAAHDGTNGALPANVTHEIRPLASAPAARAFHRFRIPLEHARVSFVDLAYQTPLITAPGDSELVINGGYWAYYGPDRRIQGLLVVNGRPLSPRAKNPSGGILHIEGGRGRMLPSSQPLDTRTATLVIQCSPRLVSQGRVIPKLDSRHLAARTALCLRDRGRVLDAYLTVDGTRTTLAELAAFLLDEGCEAALNLDGGPSTAAVFRGSLQPALTVGAGVALPYGLGFTVRK